MSDGEVWSRNGEEEFASVGLRADFGSYNRFLLSRTFKIQVPSIHKSVKLLGSVLDKKEHLDRGFVTYSYISKNSAGHCIMDATFVSSPFLVALMTDHLQVNQQERFMVAKFDEFSEFRTNGDTLQSVEMLKSEFRKFLACFYDTPKAIGRIWSATNERHAVRNMLDLILEFTKREMEERSHVLKR